MSKPPRLASGPVQPGSHRSPRPARLVSHFGNAVDVGVTSVP